MSCKTQSLRFKCALNVSVDIIFQPYIAHGGSIDDIGSDEEDEMPHRPNQAPDEDAVLRAVLAQTASI